MTRARSLLLVMLPLLWGSACSPHAGAEASRGAALFMSGASTRGTPVRVQLEDGSLQDAAAFPCARCHNDDARGTREGALVVPALLDLAPGALEAAVRDGVGRGGRRLSAAMPRYRMTPADLSDLAAHLRAVSMGAHGSAPREATIALALPVRGREAARAAFLRALDAPALARRTGLALRLVDVTDDDGGAGALNGASSLAAGSATGSEAAPLAVLVEARAAVDAERVAAWEHAGVVVVLAGQDPRGRDDTAPRGGSVFALGLASAGPCGVQLHNDTAAAADVVVARQVEVLVHGLAQADFRVSRAALVAGLEQVHLEPTAVLPSARFGRRVRAGCTVTAADEAELSAAP